MLLTTLGVPKLSDFGVSIHTQGLRSSTTASLVGTPYWMAPEVVKGKGARFASGENAQHTRVPTVWRHPTPRNEGGDACCR